MTSGFTTVIYPVLFSAGNGMVMILTGTGVSVQNMLLELIPANLYETLTPRAISSNFRQRSISLLASIFLAGFRTQSFRDDIDAR